jgi:hypothetical protein
LSCDAMLHPSGCHVAAWLWLSWIFFCTACFHIFESPRWKIYFNTWVSAPQNLHNEVHSIKNVQFGGKVRNIGNVKITEIVNDADSDQSAVAQFPYLNCLSLKSFQDLLLRSCFFVTIYY